MNHKNEIAIIFSGGEARGYAQFGVYKAIDEFIKKIT